MPLEPTVRHAQLGDRDAITRLALDNGMFEADEWDAVLEVFAGSLDGTLVDHHWRVLVDIGGDVLAAAYFAPEPFADRVWNLYFIAVDPGRQTAGAGTTLITHVEDELRALGENQARVLIVETSSTDRYVRARSFYLARGFDEEARIREYYGPADDKVVFWKAL